MKKIKENLEEYSTRQILTAILTVIAIVMLGIVIANLIYTKENFYYFYGKDNVTGRSKNCYHIDNRGDFCEIPMEVNWYYEGDVNGGR